MRTRDSLSLATGIVLSITSVVWCASRDENSPTIQSSGSAIPTSHPDSVERAILVKDQQRFDRIESLLDTIVLRQRKVESRLDRLGSLLASENDTSLSQDDPCPSKDMNSSNELNGGGGSVTAPPTLTHQPFPFIGPSTLFLQCSSIDAPIGFSLNQGFEVVQAWKDNGGKIDIQRDGCCRALGWAKTILYFPVTGPVAGLQWLFGLKKDSFYLSEGMVYSGQYDFAFGTQYSGPVISLEQNPALFVGYHGIKKDSSDEDAIYVGVSHQSNGMFLDSKSMYHTFDSLTMHDQTPLNSQEFASMGWNYWWIRSVWNFGKPGSKKCYQQLAVELRHYIPQDKYFPWQSGRLEDTSSFIDSVANLGYAQYDGLRLHYSGIAPKNKCLFRPGLDLNLQLGQPFRHVEDFSDRFTFGSIQTVLRLILDKPLANSHANGFGIQFGWEYGHILLARYWSLENRFTLGFTLPIQSSWDF